MGYPYRVTRRKKQVTTLFHGFWPGKIGFQMKLFCGRNIAFCATLYPVVFQIQCIYCSFMLILPFASTSTSTSFTNVVNLAF